MFRREGTDNVVIADDTTAVLEAAAAGDQRSWERLVDRYANLVWAVARGFQLNQVDAADVAQMTWLRLVQHLGEIRDPERLGAWLATTARREALALLRQTGRYLPVGDGHQLPYATDSDQPDRRLLRDERDAEVRGAFEQLPWRCRQLLRILMVDPAPSYAEAAAALAMPVGSIGPTRGRCLAMLRARLRAARPDDAGVA